MHGTRIYLICFLGSGVSLGIEHRLESFVFEFARPYGLEDQEKVLADADIKKLRQTLFPQLCRILDQYHGLNSDERFWDIILGYWFDQFSRLIVNRTKTVQQAFKNYQISSSVAIHGRPELATKTSYEALLATNDDLWNHQLYLKIISILNGPRLTLKTIDRKGNFDRSCYQPKPSKLDDSWLRKFLSLVLRICSPIISYLKQYDEVMIINSYLPLKEEIKLHLVLKQFPFYGDRPAMWLGLI